MKEVREEWPDLFKLTVTQALFTNVVRRKAFQNRMKLNADGLESIRLFTQTKKTGI